MVEFINLNRKNIIITGTSNGIGLELARKFLKSGNFVWGCSRSKSNISHKNYKHFVLNLEKKNEIEKWIEKVSKESSNIIDLLILNAAYYERNLNYFETEKNIIKTISINLISSILIAKKISKLMIKNNSGMILFFSSSAVVVKDIGTSTYSSSKIAIETFAEILNKELKKFKVKTFIFRINYLKTRLSKDMKKNDIKRLLDKFKTNIFSNTNKVYIKIIKLFNNKIQNQNILISDKLR